MATALVDNYLLSKTALTLNRSVVSLHGHLFYLFLSSRSQAARSVSLAQIPLTAAIRSEVQVPRCRLVGVFISASQDLGGQLTVSMTQVAILIFVLLQTTQH